MELRGRVALVTGAGKRLGRAIALALAGEGARVAVHFNTSREEAEETGRLIGAAGSEALLVQGDLREPGAPDRIIEFVEERWGDVAVLVNSASIFEVTRWPVDDDSWQQHLDVNVTAPMRLIRAATEGLRRERGVVINLIDSSWERPFWTTHVAYLVSKVALAGLTRNLAKTLAPEIRVNGVAPGAVLPPDDYDAEQLAAAIRRVPLGRWGSPEDIAHAVISLAKNGYVTGQILNVDGGRSVV